MPIGIEFVWTMSGTCRPRSDCRPIAISPAVGDVGWVGEFDKAVPRVMAGNDVADGAVGYLSGKLLFTISVLCHARSVI